jgi:WD40 repeat protein
LTTSSDPVAILWDISTGQELQRYKRQRYTISCANFSPDGQFLATGSMDKTICLWDVLSGKLLNTLTGHKEGVQTVTFSPDGKYLLSSSIDKTVKLWNAQTGQLAHNFSNNSNQFSKPIFSLDGKHIISGSARGELVVRDSHKFQLMTKLSVFEKEIGRIKLVADDILIAWNYNEAKFFQITASEITYYTYLKALFELGDIIWEGDKKTLVVDKGGSRYHPNIYRCQLT